MGSSQSKTKSSSTKPSKSPAATDTTPSSITTTSPSETAIDSEILTQVDTAATNQQQPAPSHVAQPPALAETVVETDSQANISELETVSRPPSSQTSSSQMDTEQRASTQSNGKIDPIDNSANLVTPGIKKVEDLQVNNPENYEDDTNQTGLSHYEMRIQDRFYSAPDRPRSKAYREKEQADRQRKSAREERKANKAARRKSKQKSHSNAEETQPTAVSRALEDTKKLGILNLSKMDLSAVPDEVFESMPGTARIINVQFNQLTELDVRLCDYVLVQRLIANANLLTSIPTTISRMTALKKLDLARNRLTNLPDAFGGMRQLEHVDLSENELTTVPPSLTTLSLTALNLSRNNLTIVPVGISSLQWLMDLDLSFNRLEQVPQEFMHLTQLIALNLEDNQLKDFPNEILQGCSELVTLRLRSNPISMQLLEMKDAFSQFHHRRTIKFKRQLDAGTISEADLRPADG